MELARLRLRLLFYQNILQIQTNVDLRPINKVCNIYKYSIAKRINYSYLNNDSKNNTAVENIVECHHIKFYCSDSKSTARLENRNVTR